MIIFDIYPTMMPVRLNIDFVTFAGDDIYARNDHRKDLKGKSGSSAKTSSKPRSY